MVGVAHVRAQGLRVDPGRDHQRRVAVTALVQRQPLEAGILPRFIGSPLDAAFGSNGAGAVRPNASSSPVRSPPSVFGEQVAQDGGDRHPATRGGRLDPISPSRRPSRARLGSRQPARSIARPERPQLAEPQTRVHSGGPQRSVLSGTRRDQRLASSGSAIRSRPPRTAGSSSPCKGSRPALAAHRAAEDRPHGSSVTDRGRIQTFGKESSAKS